MSKKQKITVSWSGGKDCALALYKIMQNDGYKVVSLHTSIEHASKKIGLHGIPEALIEKQANLLNIPLEKIYLNDPGDALGYEEKMELFYEKLKSQNVNRIISGDIFLEDLRAYKEELAARKDILIEFPLWGYNTKELVNKFIESGFKTIICAADASIFPPEIIGKVVDKNFLQSLPGGVDPCGERGEFHTFTFDGPLFKNRLDFVVNSYYSKSYDFKSTEGNHIKRTFFYADLG